MGKEKLLWDLSVNRMKKEISVTEKEEISGNKIGQR